jgi:hypothetical protein
MEKNKMVYITLAAQMGDANADSVVDPHLMDLRKLLEKYCNYPYAEGINEFSLILRVDGDIGFWEFEGLQKLRLMRKLRYITVDIGVPRRKWGNVSPQSLRQYLLANAKLALESFVKKLKTEQIRIDDKRLFEDFSKVENKYLNK